MTNTTQQETNPVFRRPADRNYDSLSTLIESAASDRDNSIEVRTSAFNIEFSMPDEDVMIDIADQNGDKSHRLTHYSFGQVAGMCRIPTQVLQRLLGFERGDLAVENMNTLFPVDSGEKTILVQQTRDDDNRVIDTHARAVNGSAYSRLWDADVFGEIEEWLIPQGFDPAIPMNATRSEFMRNHRTALYRGDQTSFGFFFAGTDHPMGMELGGLWPGIMVWNSEVGARSFGFHTFYYHMQSGSVIVWTPSKQKKKRFVHRGNINKGFREYVGTLETTSNDFEGRYASDVDMFNKALDTEFAKDADEAMTKLQTLGLAKPRAARVVEIAASHAYNTMNLLNLWHVTLGICTEASETSRAENLVDGSLMANKLLKKMLKA